ncbi:MAG: hypothetical protein K9M49_00380 [Candidatus Marinimicrobia bacterium]|nr:hypothetical protein [Candidatus Neomarinimicrobiota bacterium]MCF7903583.1 hypothetical protein [Candidatus Neomarinimicrobiota bacterium]
MRTAIYPLKHGITVAQIIELSAFTDGLRNDIGNSGLTAAAKYFSFEKQWSEMRILQHPTDNTGYMPLKRHIALTVGKIREYYEQKEK